MMSLKLDREQIDDCIRLAVDCQVEDSRVANRVITYFWKHANDTVQHQQQEDDVAKDGLLGVASSVGELKELLRLVTDECPVRLEDDLVEVSYYFCRETGGKIILRPSRNQPNE